MAPAETLSQPSSPDSGSTEQDEEHLEPAPPRVEWSSYTLHYVIVWLLALGCLIWFALQGLGDLVYTSATVLVGVLGIPCALALVLSFAVPISLIDESSHARGTWWVAWLWPPVLVGMLATDALVVAYVVTRVLLPYIKSW